MKRIILIIKKECLAIIWEIKRFKQYLRVKFFTIIINYIVLKMIKTVDFLREKRAK